MSANSETSKNETTTPRHHGDWNIGKLFWGLMFVMIGGMALASNFGLLNPHWNNVLRLWPIAIVAIGISILSVRNIAWKIVSAIFALVVLAAVAWALLSYPNFKVPYTYKVVNDKIELIINHDN